MFHIICASQPVMCMITSRSMVELPDNYIFPKKNIFFIFLYLPAIVWKVGAVNTHFAISFTSGRG